MKIDPTSTFHGSFVAILALAALALIPAVEDPPPADDPVPPDDTPIYDQCSATQARKRIGEKWELVDCDGKCEDEGANCGTGQWKVGGVSFTTCGCEVNAKPTLECCQLMIGDEGKSIEVFGACAPCGLSGGCEKDLQVLGTTEFVFAACK